MESTKKIHNKTFSVPTAKKQNETLASRDTSCVKADEEKETPEKETQHENVEELMPSEKQRPRKKKTEVSSASKNSRPLSDAEYREIFDAVLQQISESNVSSSAKEQETDGPCEKVLKSDAKGDIDESSAQENKPSTEDVKTVGQEKPEAVPDQSEQKDKEGDEAASVASASSFEAMAMDVDQWDRPEDMQQNNNRTPHASEVDDEHCHTPVIPHKTKKKAVRQNRLAPRKLCFDKPDTSVLCPPKKKENRPPMQHTSKLLLKEKKKKIFKAPPKEPPMSSEPTNEPLLDEKEVPGELGTWVQCSQQMCKKWRYLPDVHDPVGVADNWTCFMHPDARYNSCEKEEQEYDESDHIFTQYTLGSTVWAKMYGYPWWPGIIDIDPDYDIYCEIPFEDSMHPTSFHVVFLDERVTRAWMRISQIRPLLQSDLGEFSAYLRGHKFKKGVSTAMRKAQQALDMPLQERLENFGFAVSYKKFGVKIRRGEGHKKLDSDRMERKKPAYTKPSKASKILKQKQGQEKDQTFEKESDSDDDSSPHTGYTPDSDASISSDEDFVDLLANFRKKRHKIDRSDKDGKSKTQLPEIYIDKASSEDFDITSDDCSEDEWAKQTEEKKANDKPSEVIAEKMRKDRKDTLDTSWKSSGEQELCTVSVTEKTKKKGGVNMPQVLDNKSENSAPEKSENDSKKKKKIVAKMPHPADSKCKKSMLEKSENEPEKKKRKKKVKDDANILCNGDIHPTSENKENVSGGAHAKKAKHKDLLKQAIAETAAQQEDCDSEKENRSSKASNPQQGKASNTQQVASCREALCVDDSVSKKSKKKRKSEFTDGEQKKQKRPKKVCAVEETADAKGETPSNAGTLTSKENKPEVHEGERDLPKKKKNKTGSTGVSIQIAASEYTVPADSSAKKTTKRKGETTDTERDEKKPDMGKPETATSGAAVKIKSKSQKFVVPSRQSSSTRTESKTSSKPEDNSFECTGDKVTLTKKVKAKNTEKMNIYEKTSAVSSSQDSPRRDAEYAIPSLKKKKARDKVSPLPTAVDRDQFVPENEVPDETLEVNDDDDVLPVLCQTKEAMESRADVLKQDDDSDCLDIDLEDDMPIPCLEHVMDVKRKGLNGDEAADSDPLEMLED